MSKLPTINFDAGQEIPVTLKPIKQKKQKQPKKKQEEVTEQAPVEINNYETIEQIKQLKANIKSKREELKKLFDESGIGSLRGELSALQKQRAELIENLLK